MEARLDVLSASWSDNESFSVMVAGVDVMFEVAGRVLGATLEENSESNIRLLPRRQIALPGRREPTIVPVVIELRRRARRACACDLSSSIAKGTWLPVGS